jgi:hypothetical protein
MKLKFKYTSFDLVSNSVLLALVIMGLVNASHASNFPVSPKVESEMPLSAPSEALELSGQEQWSNHFQATTVTQARGRITSPYAGPNSLSAGYENRTSMTATLFTGHRLWKNAYAFVNPEESAGGGRIGQIKHIPRLRQD